MVASKSPGRRAPQNRPACARQDRTSPLCSMFCSEMTLWPCIVASRRSCAGGVPTVQCRWAPDGFASVGSRRFCAAWAPDGPVSVGSRRSCAGGVPTRRCLKAPCFGWRLIIQRSHCVSSRGEKVSSPSAAATRTRHLSSWGDGAWSGMGPDAIIGKVSSGGEGVSSRGDGSVHEPS